MIKKTKFVVDENIIMWAFRYALGRRTYAVSDVVEVLINIWDKLKVFTQKKIQLEIREAINQKRAGMDCDIKQWKKILDLKVKQ